MDIELQRTNTPHCRQLIHFNNAGASLVPVPVSLTIEQYLKLEQELGPYEAQRKNSVAIDKIYVDCARFLNCQPNEIALTSGATQAWYVLLHAINWQKGDKILLTNLEYGGFYLALLQLQKIYDLELEVIPVNKGIFDLAGLKARLNNKVKLVSISHLASHGGAVLPVREIGELLQKYPCYYAVDVAQSIGQLPIDVENIQCDFLIGTGRKYLRAPRGTGFLYVRAQHLPQLTAFFANSRYVNLADDKQNFTLHTNSARIFEAWESCYAIRLGLAEAMLYAEKVGLNQIWQRIQLLAHYLQEQIASIPQLQPANQERDASGIMLWNSPYSALEISRALQQREKPINIEPWNAASSPLMQFANNNTQLLRFSPHYYNTIEEIDEVVTSLKEVIAKF